MDFYMKNRTLTVLRYIMNLHFLYFSFCFVSTPVALSVPGNVFSYYFSGKRNTTEMMMKIIPCLVVCGT